MTLAAPLFTDEAAEARRRLVRGSALRTLGRRRLRGRIATALCALALVLALAPLAALLGYTAYRGLGSLSVAFFVHTATPPGIPGGGIADAIVGTLVIVALAVLAAVPLGLAVALLLVDRPGRVAGVIRFAADVLTGIPSIALGIFAYAVVVRPMGGFSGLAGSVALAVLMVPIVIRADEEAMAAVPTDLREAGLALGAPRSRVLRSVVLRGAVPGLVTGNLLALARAVGETAPVLFVIGVGAFGSRVGWNPLHPLAAMPVDIYENGTAAFPAQQAGAWGTALVLLLFVLLLSVTARIVAARLNRKAR